MALRRIQLDDQNSAGQTAEDAALVTLHGGVVLAPTDTVYGLHCHPFQPAALQRLVEAKRRAEEKGFLLLIPEAGWVEELSPHQSSLLLELASLIWPGPVTVLAEGHTSLSPLILGREGKVGMRLPDSAFLADWMTRISSPLVSTSANLAGEEMPRSLSGMRTIFEDGIDLFVEGPEPAAVEPSSVLDLTSAPPRIIRRGAGLSRIESALATLGLAGGSSGETAL